MNTLCTITSSPRNQPPPPVQNHPSPLEIPEILERIFTFLDERSLVTSLRRVCSLWYTVIQRRLQTSVILDVAQEQKTRDDTVAAIPKATRVILGTSTKMDHEHVKAELARLPSVFSAKHGPQTRGSGAADLGSTVLESTGHVPLRELGLGRGFSTMSALHSLLPSSTYLTRLALHHDNFYQSWLDLGTILQVYPGLVELQLFSSIDHQSGFVVLEQGTLSLPTWNRSVTVEDLERRRGPISSRPIPSFLRLKSINFRGLSISPSTLQDLLSASAATLRDLHLWGLRIGNDPTIQDGLEIGYSSQDVLPPFVEFLLGLGLNLRAFSFSVKSFPQQESLVLSMHKRNIMGALGSKVKTWGFPIGFCHTLISYVPNTITTLALMPEQGPVIGGGQRFLGRLHDFLCFSPLLLHLRAPGVSFDVDLLIPCSENGSWLTGRPTTRKVWACSELRTLHMAFCSPDRTWAIYGVQSRIVFGYLVRICPQLEDLHFGWTLNMKYELEDGIAILARLQHLKRLAFWLPSYSMSPQKALNRLWAVVQPNALDKIQQLYTIMRWRSKLVKEDSELKPLVDVIGTGSESEVFPQGIHGPFLEPWMESRYIGSLLDVKMVLQDLGKDPERRRWWPLLREIDFRHCWKVPAKESFQPVYSNSQHHRTIYSRQPFLFTDQSRTALFPPIHPIE